MKAAISQSSLTTLFGILAGLPVLVVQSMSAMNVALPPTWAHILLMVGAVGLIGLGIVAKAYNVHSTTSQVEASQAAVVGNPEAPAMMKAADLQVEKKP